jgi:flagellar motor protein MotB
MAGKHGGGAWKVAYADFITALMAFFLVMWICVQDQKIKEAVAHYFMDPTGGTPIGASAKPSNSGAIFDGQTAGTLPKSESVMMGRGRQSHTLKEPMSPPTKLVSDWLHSDDATYKHWREEAQRVRELAKSAPEVRKNPALFDEVAARMLAKQLKEEFIRGVPDKADGLHQDLLYEVLTEVNWLELAEDLLQ